MNKILKKTYFSEKVVQMVVEAPLIAKSRKPGNFVIVRVGENGSIASSCNSNRNKIHYSK